MSTRVVTALILTLSCGLALPACAGKRATDAEAGGGSALAPVPVKKTPETEYEKYHALGYTLAWRGFPLVSRRASAKFFDAFGDSLVFQDSANVLTVMDAGTGRNRWSAQVDESVARFTGNAVGNDRVYSSSDNELFVLDLKTGAVLERHKLAVVVDTPPVLVGNLAVFGSTTGEVLGHSLVSQYKLWAYRMSGPVTSAPVFVGRSGNFNTDALAAVAQTGEVLVLDPKTGASISRSKVFSGLTNRAVASEDLLYLASTDQSVYAIEIRTGAQRWRHRTERPLVEQPALHGGRLFVTIPGKGLTCFDGSSGDVLWSNAEQAGSVIGVRAGRLIVWDGTRAASVDPERGDVVERVALEGVERLVSDPFEDGSLYAVTREGRVSKFSSR